LLLLISLLKFVLAAHFAVAADGKEADPVLNIADFLPYNGLAPAYGKGFHIDPHEPGRDKKLLLHREEIKRIARRVDEKGYTLVPLSFYFKNRKVKVELGLCKGKKLYDKRADIRERDLDREMQREFKGKLK
jgi:tmRNA-binding protein